ncbi:hypothetical protein F4778DRAFT_713028 [Xylariomycetidae sp. FL2044]|nr:hypothetical protein F4778DRAFT_713028 [Xylariomycetidae sp. FL2044]
MNYTLLFLMTLTTSLFPAVICNITVESHISDNSTVITTTQHSSLHHQLKTPYPNSPTCAPTHPPLHTHIIIPCLLTSSAPTHAHHHHYKLEITISSNPAPLETGSICSLVLTPTQSPGNPLGTLRSRLGSGDHRNPSMRLSVCLRMRMRMYIYIYINVCVCVCVCMCG